MSDKYRIDCLSDFLKVPHEKQAECLEDFAVWLDMCRREEELQAAIAEDFPGVDARLNTNGFFWVDDGERKISDVSFTVDGEEIGSAKRGEA